MAWKKSPEMMRALLNAFVGTLHKARVEDEGEMKAYDSDLKNYFKKMDSKSDDAVEIP